jgi:predicted nucleotidyltransferase
MLDFELIYSSFIFKFKSKKNNKLITQSQIEEVKNRIVEKFHPEKIILFGSYANGEPNDESDLDLLIIQRTDLPRKERRLPILKMLRDMKIAMDILIYTPNEVEYWKDTPAAFVTQIINDVKVIYE